MSVPETEVIVQIDGAEAARHVVRPGDYVLGRAPDADLRIEAELVSRRHARLIVNYDHALIEDLGSSNGTFVNGQPITESTRLWPGQKIQVGAATVELRRRKVEADPEVTLPPVEAALQRLLPEELLRERRYDIGAQVARGGMGAILDAREAAIERRVAMKVMLDGMSADDLSRFVAEAKITGQLEHPNIVPVHELGVDENGQPFYTMKMVRGISLKKVLDLLAAGVPETVEKYPLSARLTIFQKVCDGIAFAHSKRVIHRDLKPENIMLGEYGEALVMDWGLAKVFGSRKAEGETRNDDAPLRPVVLSVRAEQGASGSTQAGTILGTPQYMSPEQADGDVEGLDERTDVYALGSILFHLLELRPPVTGATVEEVLEKVRRGEVASLQGEGAPSPRDSRDTGRGRPSSLVAVVRKAMALRKEDRYPSVQALQAEIAKYQAGFATEAENASLWKQGVLLVRRHKGIFTTAAAAWAIITALAAWFVVNVTRERNRAERGEAAANVERERAETHLAQAEETLRQLQFRKAIETLDDGKTREALARFAAILRAEPDHPTAASLLLSALSHHSFILPAAPPLLVNPEQPIFMVEARFSPQGRLLAYNDSIPGRLWDPHSGQPLGPRLARGRHAVFLPDGRRVVIGGNSWDHPPTDIKELAVWDAVEGRKLKVLPHAQRVTSLTLSKDGSRLLTATQDGRIAIWNTLTLEKESSDLIGQQPNVAALACNDDVSWVFARTRSGPGQFWDRKATTGAATATTDRRTGWWVHFDPAGRGYFAIQDFNWWRLLSWDGYALAQGRNAAPVGYDALAIAADGHRLVPLSVQQNSARIWSVESAQPIGHPLLHGAEIRHADFGPADWRILTVAGNREVGLWSGRDGRPLAPPTMTSVIAQGDPNSGATYAPAFSPVDDLIALRSDRSQLPVYDIRYRAEIPLTLHDVESSSRSALSPDGRWIALASSGDNKVTLHDSTTGERMAELRASARSFQAVPIFSADSRLLACPVAEKRVELWEIPSGKSRGQFEFGDEAFRGSQIFAALSSDGTRLAIAATGTADVTIRQTADVAEPPARPHARGTTLVIEFSPDDALLAHGVVAAKNPFRMLDTATGKPLWEIGSQARDADFSPSALWVALAHGRSGAQLYDRRTGAPHGPRLIHGSAVSFVRFSPDGQLVATVGEDDTVRLWNPETGAPLLEPMRHSSAITSLAFSPDSRRLAVGTRDGQLRLWNVRTAQPASPALPHRGAIHDLAFSPDGCRLHVLVRSTQVCIYEVPPPPRAPRWLADLAEAVAATRIAPDGELTDADVPLFWPTREYLLAKTVDDPFWGRWLRWFCADPATRTISAFSDRPTAEVLDAFVASGKRDALETALLYRPRDPAILSALAKAIRASGQYDPTMKADADFLEALATQRRKMAAAPK